MGIPNGTMVDRPGGSVSCCGDCGLMHNSDKTVTYKGRSYCLHCAGEAVNGKVICIGSVCQNMNTGEIIIKFNKSV